MSKDLQIAHLCPHYIRYERVGLQNESHIIPSSPISGDGLIEIYRDGVLLDSQGNTREAILTSSNSSPFRVKRDSNTLTVSTTDGFLNTVVIPSKIYNSSSLVKELNGKLGPIFVSETSTKAISFSDRKLGVGYTLKGSLLKSLGFSRQKQVVKTKKITPSWNLSPRLNGYDVAFSEKLEPEGLLEISYTTNKQFCRRCGNTGIENDFRFDEFGGLKKIGNTDLLYQSVAKILLTEIGSNPYHDWYGSNAFRLIGQKNSSAAAQSLRLSVQQALTKLQSVQQKMSRVQQITSEERLVSVRSVNISQINDNATSLLCNVVVVSGANRPVSVNIVFSVPGAISLDGDLT